MVLFAVLLLAGCGGGSSGGESTEGSSEMSDDANLMDDGGAMTPPEGGVPPVQAGDTDPATDEGGSPEDESEGLQEVPDITSGPVAIFAVDGPAPGIPGGFIESLNIVDIEDNGFMFAAATIRGSLDGQATWSGKAHSPVLLYQSGDPLTGDTSDGSFNNLVTGSVANDGSLALIVNTSANGRALVLIDSSGRQALLRTGDTTEGPYDDELDSSQQITDLLAVRHSNQELLVLVELVQGDRFRPSKLWLQHGSAGFTQVIRVAENNVAATNQGPSAMVDGMPECRLYAAGNEESLSASDSFFELANTGHILIDGVRSCDNTPTSTSVFGANVVARRSPEGNWETVVAEGAGVPDAPEAIYSEVKAISLSDDTADTLIQAQLDIPEVIGGVDSFFGVESFWLHPIGSPVRLLSLQGESIQVVDQSESISALGSGGEAKTLQDFRRGIAAISYVGERGAGVILRGTPHESSQPHASLAAPGAASLSAVASVGATGLPGMLDGSSFEALSRAELDNVGNAYFAADSVSTDPNVDPERGLWRADANGQLQLIISEFEEVTIAGIPREVGDLLLNITRVPDTLLRATDDGNLYFLTRLRGAANDSSALIRLSSPNN